MRLHPVTLLLLLATVCYTVSNDTVVVKSNGEIDPVKLQSFIREVPKVYQTRAFNGFFTVVPRPQDIGEGGVVFYSTDTQVCYMYTLQNGTTFSVKMTP